MRTTFILLLSVLCLTLTGCPSEEGDNTPDDTNTSDTASNTDTSSNNDTTAQNDTNTGSDTNVPTDTTPPTDTNTGSDTNVPTDTTPPSDTTNNGDPLAALDDDFSGSDVSSDWLVFNAPMFTFGINAGELFMEPVENVCNSFPYCVWFNNDNGPLLYKMVAGDFRVSARVKARSSVDPNAPPPPRFHFAGLIARDPASDSSGLENYIFTVMGDRGGYLTNEVKSTVDGNSNVRGPDNGITDADSDLRLCRVGQVFHLYNRPYGTNGAWQLEYTWDRAQDPVADTLQVGLIAYNYSSVVDILGLFDDVTFRTVSGESDCTTLD